MNLGKNVLVSILDIFEKNPYSRIPNTQQRSLDQIRKEVAQECARYDRFRADPVAFKKIRVISEYIHENFFLHL
jgi:cytosolic carboxypeptidase protein 5